MGVFVGFDELRGYFSSDGSNQLLISDSHLESEALVPISHLSPRHSPNTIFVSNNANNDYSLFSGLDASYYSKVHFVPDQMITV